MFYKMITTARDRWYQSPHCTVNSLVNYIIYTGQMRDAQIEAIKTYLFLKIGCENKPLNFLFSHGIFNNLNLNDIEVSNNVREYLEEILLPQLYMNILVLQMIRVNRYLKSLKSK